MPDVGGTMRKGIHPEYMESRVVCACGEEFVTRAGVPDIHVEICSQCHPFYTGKQKILDSGGRVQRFQRKYARFYEEEEVRKRSAEQVAETSEPEPSEDAAESTGDLGGTPGDDGGE